MLTSGLRLFCCYRLFTLIPRTRSSTRSFKEEEEDVEAIDVLKRATDLGRYVVLRDSLILRASARAD